MADWSISIPLADLQKLLASVGQLEDITAKISQLEREISGLRQIQNDTIQRLADMKYQSGKS